MQKQKRDAKVTKEKILVCARELFSKKGFDATTMDDVAQRSGFNKALIYYYFKNKSALYSMVMSELFDEIYEKVRKKQKNCESIEEELKTFIYTYTQYAYEHPYFPALLLRELSDSGAHLPEMMFERMRRLFVLLSDILARGEKKGVFCHNIPMVIHFMIIGSINLMITTQPLRKKAITLQSNIDTCASCSMEMIAEYIFVTVKKSLEVK